LIRIIREQALLQDASRRAANRGGAPAVTSGGVVGEVQRFLDRGIAAADHRHLLAAEEEAVAGGAGGDAEALEAPSRRQAQPAGLGAGGDDQASPRRCRR
jgi:hypothetical protein